MDKKLFDEMLRRAAPQFERKAPAYPILDLTITHYVYDGPREELKGEMALGRYEFGKFLVQFNNRELPDNLAFGWHEFDKFEFVAHAELI
ncbi:MAG: hypothetical protein ACXWWG_00580 [Nitrospira sp.]